MAYNINTMTIIGKLSERNDFSEVQQILTWDRKWKNDELRPVGLRYMRGSEVIEVGECVKKTNGKQRKFRKRMFDNQVTVFFKTSKKTFLNMKVFRTGSVQVTGARSRESAVLCMEILAAWLRKSVCHDMTKTVLMNTDYDAGERIDPMGLYLLVREHDGLMVSYQPEIHPAVKVGYYYNTNKDGKCPAEHRCDGKGRCCKKVTVMVFHTGKIICTGGNLVEQIDSAMAYITDAVRRAKVLKNVLEEKNGISERHINASVSDQGDGSSERGLVECSCAANQ